MSGNHAYTAMSWYARKMKWQVFPCRFKAPFTPNGLLDATTNPQVIRAWSQRWPDAGVAIRTGAGSGIFVLDVDPRHGGDESFQELIGAHGPLPATVEAITGGGGRHLYFRHPGRHIKNTEHYPLPGLDVRGDSGYVVAAPTMHESGIAYTWEVSSRPDAIPVAAAPPWLIALLTSKAEQPTAAALPEVIREGQRDATLTSLAGSMRRRGASQAAILAALREENTSRCVPPLDDDQVTKIALSVARYDPARLEAEGIDVWETIIGGRFQESPEGDENWDKLAADLEVGAMFYRMGEHAAVDDQGEKAIAEAFHLRSWSALYTAVKDYERAVRGG